MLHLLGWLFYGACAVDDAARNMSYIERSKEHAKENGLYYYNDIRGRSYFIKTGERCYLTTEGNNQVLKSVRTNRVIFNITLHKHLDNLQSAKEQGYEYVNVFELNRYYIYNTSKPAYPEYGYNPEYPCFENGKKVEPRYNVIRRMEDEQSKKKKN